MTASNESTELWNPCSLASWYALLDIQSVLLDTDTKAVDVNLA